MAPSLRSAPPAGTGRDACFHCGLPVPAGRPRAQRADGEPRAFCCAGCQAVSSAILGQGLGDYYRLREGVAGRAPDDADDLALYDDPLVQERFVRADGPGRLAADLVLEGITCPACCWLVEQTLSRTPGVISADVNYATRRARIAWNPARVRLSSLLGSILRVGYRAWPYEEKRVVAVGERERRTMVKRLAVAALGMMQVMMYAVPAYLAGEGEIGADAASLMRWAGFVLTVPVIVYSAAPFFRGAWRDLRLARLGMDVPVALGLAVAFAASAWATVAGAGAVYFDSVAMFVFLLTGGRYLELEARRRAGDALGHLARLAPQAAHRLKDGGGLAFESVPATRLVPGDRVLVRPGETIPADAELMSPEAVVNESLLTGEGRPVQRLAGDALVGGSANAGGVLVARVTRVGEQTTLSSIQRLMERALRERPPWVAAAERATGVFVAFVLAAAIAAGFAWLAIDSSRALWVAVSVLIVTCPCALALAAPMANTIAVGSALQHGLVVTRGGAIEALAGATDVVFDKTGTLTSGRPEVVEVVPLGELDRAACLAVGAAIGRLSNHPLDKAIVQAAGAGAATAANDPRFFAASGIEARVDGRITRVGRGDFVAALHGHPAPISWLRSDHSVVWLGDERGWIAAFRIGDGIRPGAAEAIRELRAAGLEVHLLTGDDGETARRVAEELGMARVEARATPEHKQAYVRALQLAGARVAMVGDGINDAPVLAQADVSIAMGGGADLAQVRADAVLVSDSPTDLAAAFGLARRARRVIRQNIAWALAYNLVAIPLAFAGWVTPLAAGVGMSASSLLVVANALRLRERWISSTS